MHPDDFTVDQKQVISALNLGHLFGKSQNDASAEIGWK